MQEEYFSCYSSLNIIIYIICSHFPSSKSSHNDSWTIKDKIPFEHSDIQFIAYQQHMHVCIFVGSYYFDHQSLPLHLNDSTKRTWLQWCPYVHIMNDSHCCWTNGPTIDQADNQTTRPPSVSQPFIHPSRIQPSSVIIKHLNKSAEISNTENITYYCVF